ncbi:MAG: hypothetical protein WC859_09135 [Elusimicrobiota bacterium]
MNVRRGAPSCFLAVCLFWGTNAGAVEYVEKKFVFTRTDSQEHFWLGAGGTFIGTQTLRLMNVPRLPATWVAATGVLGVGVAKEFLVDSNPSVNDLMADGLGVALGTLACFTFRFDGYFDDGPLPITKSQPDESPPKGKVIPMKVLGAPANSQKP